jgi:hypothetical protein
MNTSRLLTLSLITATAGLATFGLANTELAARLPIESFLAATVSIGLLRFAVADYASRPKPLTAAPAPILRPVAARRTVRVAAYVERIAA